MKSVCWFRNDLRVLDNPALHHCCKNSDEVIAVYFINRAQWQEHDDALIKINFWLRNLEKLKNKLKNLNIPLVVLEANDYTETALVLKDFCDQHDVKNLYFNNEYPVNELERDRNIYSGFKDSGIGVFTYHDQVIHEPGSLKTTTGNNFSVYSPFKRKWFEELTDDQLVLFDIPTARNLSLIHI